ncbi:hypothetical protein [Anaeromyxobacter diazotrophicus]|uniref:Uncharacterized protein n=1 Tax=Anaeromyxobacter diazotrophicus TaxID=2590199 RepID=A0A7I9VPR0_9BACT|nr:hypothetical protein [Anaeromyxobacter diazotrophicus]GEJ58404.1 hypothetical protein AMYX_31450 [Anaeromyxobacter diazotrophicus]
MPEADPAALERLVEDGLLQRGPRRLRTSPRWQAAMARAALALQRAGAPWADLRLPIAAALVERYPGLEDAALAPLVEAMLAVEQSELPAVAGGAGAR